jgi:tetratricopeptide (TPR) repeat protein
LAPNASTAKFELGLVLATVGNLEQAVDLTQQAIDGDPLRAIWYNWLAVYLSALNRLDEAERAIRKAIELQPGAESFYYLLSNIEVRRGDAKAALSAAQQESPGPWQDISLAIARQIGADRSAANAALRMRNSRDGGPRFHGMSVQHFSLCRPGISRHVGPVFHGMSVQLVR